MRDIADRSCRGNQNTHFVFNNFFFKNCAVFEIMWKIIVEWVSPQMTVWRIRITFRIAKATNPHSQYVILLFHCNSGCRNTPQCYVIRTLPVFLFFTCVVIPFCGYVWAELYMNGIDDIPSALIEFLQFTYILFT